MTEIAANEETERRSMNIFPRRLACASLLAGKDRVVLLAASKQGEIYMASQSHGEWKSRCLSIEKLENEDVQAIKVVTPLNLFIVAVSHRVHLVSAEDGLVVHSLQTTKMLPRTWECSYKCHGISHTGAAGLASFTMGYVEASSKDCILQTFFPPDGCDVICVQTPCERRSNDRCTLDTAKVTKKRVADPGVWDIVFDGSAVGIRYKAPAARQDEYKASPGLRNRFCKQAPEPDPLEGWEIWTASSASSRCDEAETQRLVKDGEQADHLLVTELGPKAKVGLNCVAFAFGDMIKLVAVGGKVRLDQGPEDTARGARTSTGSRRRKPGVELRLRTAP